MVRELLMYKASVTLNFYNKKLYRKKEKTVMVNLSKSQWLNLGVGVLTILGMVIGSKAQDAEIKELKQEIMSEIAEKGEK